MFHPNLEAAWQAFAVLLLATPFMFLTLTLFSLLIMVLSRIPDVKKHEE